MSISHALSLAESVRHRLACASDDPANIAVTPDEVAEGRFAQAKARAVLASCISTVDQTLGALRKQSAHTPTPAVRERQNPFKLSVHDIAPAGLGTTNTLGAARDPAFDSVWKGFSADGLEPGTRSLEEMANAIAPIIDRFDDVLRLPYLQDYSATLNTVPVVGLKGRNVMYINTTPASNGSGLQHRWETFSALPSNATPSASNVAHIFPYRGSFYLSVGRSVWKKDHISQLDQAGLKGAVNNWPGMFVRDWTFIGNSVLPVSNLAGVVPFSVLSADRQQIAFELVILAANGDLSYLTNDTLGNNGTYAQLRFTPSTGSPPTSPRFVKVAYWDGHMVGTDNQSNTWRITPDWSAHTYSVSNQFPITPVTEFTADDSGLVGLRSDGYLWRRVVEAPATGTSDDATLKWLRWIRADGVTNLGVASPGVLLDMNLLTSTLRSRYIDVQTSVYPVVNIIRAFSITHQFWLNSTLQAARDWQNATTAEQRRIAIQTARSFVPHAQMWSNMVSGNITGAQDSVNIMTLQLREVRDELEQQLVLLRDKLAGLQATLNTQQEQMTQLKAAFWGSIAGMLLGVALAIVGFVLAQPKVILVAGLLFVGGLVSTIVFGIRMSQLAAEIANTEAQIRDVNTAIEQLGIISASFTELDELYGTLNEFWGRMRNDASAIQEMDDISAQVIGTEILYYTTTLEASLAMTTQLTQACQTYLDVLNRQGIQIPTRLLDTPCDKLLTQARRAIRSRDQVAYEKTLKQAALIYLNSLHNDHRAAVASGQWFDVPALRNNSSIWQNHHAFTRYVNLPASLRTSSNQTERSIARNADDMDGTLNEARPFVEGMLRDILALGDTIQGWTAEFPVLPTDPEERLRFERKQREAIAACETAMRKAALANNKFAEFTNQAREYQHGLDRKIRECQDQITQERRRAEHDLNNIRVPWYVYLGGGLSVIAWREMEKSRINARLASAIGEINEDIARFRQLQSSGHSFEGEVLTWINMTQAVSGNLGSIYNTLTGMWGQLLGDPILYREFLQIQWDSVVRDAQDVLDILGSRPFTITTDASETLPGSHLHDSPTHAMVVAALHPSHALAEGISTQITSAHGMLDRLHQLTQSPLFADIVGYWSVGDIQRNTFLDVVGSLRTEYFQMVAAEYETIESLVGFSILQGTYARNVVDGKRSLEHFSYSAERSLYSALQSAQRTTALFGDASKKLETLLCIIDQNIEEVVKLISDLGDEVMESDLEARKKTVRAMSNIISLVFAGSRVLVTLGVVGPVAAVVSTSTRLNFSNNVTSSSIQLVLESLPSTELVKVTEGLKTARKILRDHAVALETVQSPFAGVVEGLNGLARNIGDTHATLKSALEQVDSLNRVSFTADDAAHIKHSWDQVREAAEAWMAVMNKQGISPFTFSMNNAKL